MEYEDKEELRAAISKEAETFRSYYLWLEANMPKVFFKEITGDHLLLITHSLMGFDLENFFSIIHIPTGAIVLCLESSDADVSILKQFSQKGIKSYTVYISKTPPPKSLGNRNLRIAYLDFIDSAEKGAECTERQFQKVREGLKVLKIQASDAEIQSLVGQLNNRFVSTVTEDLIVKALEMFYRAQNQDHCQYEVIHNQDWQESGRPSVQIVFGWKNIPKDLFLYHVARLIYRHNLVMKKVNASYVKVAQNEDLLLMVIGLNGIDGRAAWESTDIQDFVKELVTLRYFNQVDLIDKVFVESRLLKGNLANFLRAMVDYVHQMLVQAEPYRYTVANIEEGFTRHPELTLRLCKGFEAKFNPESADMAEYHKIKDDFLTLVDKLDTGNEEVDSRRKNILKQGLYFIHYMLKTNFYRPNKVALSFRIDPKILDFLPYTRGQYFPLLPFAIFFIKGLYFFGFHIRFKDLARGGLRTVFPKSAEFIQLERNNIFMETYSLAYTQHKKNKDIPEGGAKGVIFLTPLDEIDRNVRLLKEELALQEIPEEEKKGRVDSLIFDQRNNFLHQSQRAFVFSLLTLVNCEESGQLKASNVISYYHKPEYLYLGPDENMHNEMLSWIAHFSKFVGYKPGSSFISSKPKGGINHKEHGVTSLGVNAYMREVLKYLEIDPSKEPFTIKMSGGPDGDVAGNQIYNLYRFYKETAKLVALTDVSGTIYDPNGLRLEEMLRLFRSEKPIAYYSPELLSEGGFLLDLKTKRDQDLYSQQTLCFRKKEGHLCKEWLSGNEMNELFRQNVHKTKADIFIPCGGRPATLNHNNYVDFLDENGKPTSKAIVEGANLYLTAKARKALEELGVLIIKDSSANKGGVIASSYEVLAGLVLSDEELIEHHALLVKEVLEVIEKRAIDEARLLLTHHKRSGLPLTEISDLISQKMNTYTYEILDHLEKIPLSSDPRDPFIQCLLAYALAFLRDRYASDLIDKLPEGHKKAIIACYLASKVVYSKGLDWNPSLVDVLPVLLKEMGFHP